jgi:hypothetical protein
VPAEPEPDGMQVEKPMKKSLRFANPSSPLSVYKYRSHSKASVHLPNPLKYQQIPIAL